MIEDPQTKNKVIDIIPSPQKLTKSYQNVNHKKEQVKYWTQEYIDGQIKKIDNFRHKIFFILLWRSGIRITEAVSLCKSDIDLTNRVMTVKWLKSRKYQYRNVPIHKSLADILMPFIAPLKSDTKLFDWSRQFGWRLSIKYFGDKTHRFRHSFAIHFLRSGGELIILHKILGHSKIQTTMQYLDIVPIDQLKEIDKINF